MRNKKFAFAGFLALLALATVGAVSIVARRTTTEVRAFAEGTQYLSPKENVVELAPLDLSGEK
jgi:hypothetical protein